MGLGIGKGEGNMMADFIHQTNPLIGDIVKEYLKLPCDGVTCITVSPAQVNPFLRCIESFENEAPIIECVNARQQQAFKKPGTLPHNVDNSFRTYYRIFRKEPMISEYTVCNLEQVPGVGMVNNYFFNGSAKVKTSSNTVYDRDSNQIRFK